MGALDGLRIVVAAARIGDDPIARLGEDRLLVAPDQRAAARGVEEHDGLAAAPGVPEPQARIGKRGNAFPRRRLGRERDRYQRIGGRRLGARARSCAHKAAGESGERGAHLQ
jgi:hypothetical protein